MTPTRREFMEAGAGAFLLCLQKFSILSMVPPDIEESSEWWDGGGDGGPCGGLSTEAEASRKKAADDFHAGRTDDWISASEFLDQFNTRTAEAAMRDFHAGRWEHARDILDQMNDQPPPQETNG